MSTNRTDRSDEDARIARHLASAEAQLRARDVSHLSHAHRVVRSFVIEGLRSYRLAGRFPRNTVRSERTPVFIDPHGTRCAMAHLLELVGAHALVARVARDANLARIHDLADDPELLHWLNAMGITIDEAARIQPTYCESSRADCWCGGGGVEAVVLATWLGPTESSAARTYRVDEVLGGTLVAAGETITAQYWSVLPEPTGQIVLALRKGRNDVLYGWPSPLPREIGLSSGRCDVAAAAITPARELVVRALLSPDCEGTLIAADPRLSINSCNPDPNAVPDAGPASAQQVEGGGCTWAHVDGAMAPQALMLLSIALFARRRFAQRARA